ncbi:hypothetical protein SRB5_39120 [Streptomyces sp. RB5]|uniref:Uncharacterized protein n=1 Tax=Streptomyces smaragdinus TaxID=2585196 RepID=A0A7K0CJU3_9ACTN|nr:hypothetical protein [Streptomyces smaragdinus]
MILALIVFVMLATLAALGLVACSRREPSRHLLPAVRTVAVLGVAVVYVVWLFTLGGGR